MINQAIPRLVAYALRTGLISQQETTRVVNIILEVLKLYSYIIMKYNFRFIAGSQFLYDSEAFEAVEARTNDTTTEVSMVLPYSFIREVTAMTNNESIGMAVINSDDDVDIKTMVSGI